MEELLKECLEFIEWLFTHGGVWSDDEESVDLMYKDVKTIELRKKLKKYFRKPNKAKDLKEALELPGMLEHLRRKKVAWKIPNASEKTIELWIRHKIAQEIHSKLMGMPISTLLKIRSSLCR